MWCLSVALPEQNDLTHCNSVSWLAFGSKQTHRLIEHNCAYLQLTMRHFTSTKLSRYFVSLGVRLTQRSLRWIVERKVTREPYLIDPK